MGRRRRASKGDYWIQEAVENPGALKAWLRRNEDLVRRITGESPFDRNGRVKVTVLRQLKAAYKRGRLDVSPTTIRRINLALTLRRLGRRRK